MVKEELCEGVLEVRIVSDRVLVIVLVVEEDCVEGGLSVCSLMSRCMR